MYDPRPKVRAWFRGYERRNPWVKEQAHKKYKDEIQRLRASQPFWEDWQTEKDRRKELEAEVERLQEALEKIANMRTEKPDLDAIYAHYEKAGVSEDAAYAIGSAQATWALAEIARAARRRG